MRRRDPAPARDASTALTAIDAQRVDWRDVTVAAALLSYALGREGTDSRSPFIEAAESGEATVAEILRRFVREPARSLRPWGYREVETAAGTVLFEDSFHRFQPTIDLAALALAIAGVLEADAYRVTSVGVGSELPTVWLGGDAEVVRAATTALAGCIVIHARLVPTVHETAESQQFTIFLAEAATAADAAAFAAASELAAGAAHEALGVAHERVCCIAIARSFVEGVPAFERPGALERFRASFAALLNRAV